MAKLVVGKSLTTSSQSPIVPDVKQILNGLPRTFVAVLGGCVGVGFLLYSYCAPFCFETYGDGYSTGSELTAVQGIDLRTRLAEATVKFGDTECERWTGNRWDCERQPWLWVGTHQGRLTTPTGPEWRRCIWAHAHASNEHDETLKVAWSSLEWDGPLHGEVGILDTAAPGGDALFRVLVDGRQRASSRITNARVRRDYERRWRPWSVPAKRLKKGPRTVTFEITASDGAWRQVCFTAFAGGVAP